MEKRIIEILGEVGDIKNDGHFVLNSWRHSGGYINLEKLFEDEIRLKVVSALVATRLTTESIDVMLGPAEGGNILGRAVATALSSHTRREIVFVETVKTAEGGQEIKTDHLDLVWRRRAFIVEDVSTTGGSIMKVADALRAAGAIPTGVFVLVNRDRERVNSDSLKLPLRVGAYIEFESYAEEECPLCLANVPVNTEVGHGREFLERRKRR